MYALPTRISRYEIKSLIGRGGMGDLYLAFDPNTNRLVAIKLLNATLDSNEPPWGPPTLILRASRLADIALW